MATTGRADSQARPVHLSRHDPTPWRGLRRAGLGRRLASLVRALRTSPVTASPYTGIRSVAANAVERPADAAAAASARVLRTTARTSVGKADLGHCNRKRVLMADAAVTCVSQTSAPAVTSERRHHPQQHRRCPRSPLRCGNMCNASTGCLEHVRRIVCAEGTTQAHSCNRCALCDERHCALPLRGPFCYLGPRTATRNVLDDRGPVVSLNRRGGSKSLICRRFRRWWCAGFLYPISTPFGVLPSHPTQFLCGVCHARACPAALCDLSDLECPGVDGPSVCS